MLRLRLQFLEAGKLKSCVSHNVSIQSNYVLLGNQKIQENPGAPPKIQVCGKKLQSLNQGFPDPNAGCRTLTGGVTESGNNGDLYTKSKTRKTSKIGIVNMVLRRSPKRAFLSSLSGKKNTWKFD